jgi:hypothetical protein
VTGRAAAALADAERARALGEPGRRKHCRPRSGRSAQRAAGAEHPRAFGAGWSVPACPTVQSEHCQVNPGILVWCGPTARSRIAPGWGLPRPFTWSPATRLPIKELLVPDSRPLGASTGVQRSRLSLISVDGLPRNVRTREAWSVTGVHTGSVGTAQPFGADRRPLIICIPVSIERVL